MEAYKMCKQEQVTQEEQRHKTYRSGVRKARAHLQLNLSKDMKCSRQGFYGDISSKRMNRENVGPLLNSIGIR